MPLPIPAPVADALRRSTVQIHTSNSRSCGSGSGVALEEGRVVTNAHVVRGANVRVQSCADAAGHPASLVRVDTGRDLALLSVPGLNAPPATLADSDALRPGLPVFAVGNPLGFVGALSSGVLHGVAHLGGRSWLQADVRLAPGSSGGPLADLHGRIVGINTMVVVGGLALSIPSRAVSSFLARVYPRPRLGITIRPISLPDRRAGMLILEVAPHSLADLASLLPGDILCGANGRTLESPEDLEIALDGAGGPALSIAFYRGARRNLRRVTVDLAAQRTTNAA